ncbi:ERF family protein [Streptomyces sp. NPDC006967]|uniref:ERF family protein n=1 Tax=Streptomyces sp. NPDC006967 TaxID=3156906 RepID=UPI0033FD6075
MTVTALPLPPQTAPTPGGPAGAPIYQPAPAGVPDDTPRVFAAVAAVMRDALPVGKDKQNTQQNYKFRGIDDVMSAMAGPMRRHGVFILPTIADHQQQRDGKMTRVLITMRYSIYGPAGDCLTAYVPGEAFDFADKATNKAQSAALKYLLFTLFMLPVDGRSIDDGDRHHPEPSEEHKAEQQQRQQRGQQRRQQRQQGAQQPRRSNRAEPGPWEQGQEQPQQQAPRRDYLTEAHQARNPEEFAAVRAAAVEAGAPAEYLARLDTIAEQKRAAAQPPQQNQRPAPPAPDPVDEVTDAAGEASWHGEPAKQAAAAQDAHDRAENALRLAASRANLPTLDGDFQRVFGKTIGEADAVTLDAFRARIEQAAAGGAQ